MKRVAEAVSRESLPRSIVGRGFLLILSVGAIAFASVFLYGLAIGPAGRTWGEWLRIATCRWRAPFTSGWVGLMWAVAGRLSWLPAVALRAGRWLAVCLVILRAFCSVCCFGRGRAEDSAKLTRTIRRSFFGANRARYFRRRKSCEIPQPNKAANRKCPKRPGRSSTSRGRFRGGAVYFSPESRRSEHECGR